MRIKTAFLRDLEHQVMKGEISYSKMVELLNEKANEKEPSNDEKNDLFAIKASKESPTLRNKLLDINPELLGKMNDVEYRQIGFLFENYFYELDEKFEGFTFSEASKPKPIYEKIKE